MKLDYAISPLTSTGTVPMSVAMVGDMYDLDDRIKNGDESGWRGDPTMCINLNTITGWWEVWGIDRAGKQYLAASHDKLDHTLLIKLREGDPRKNDVFERVLKANQKLKDDQKQADDENFAEIAAKVQHAINKDFHGRHNPVTVDRKPGD